MLMFLSFESLKELRETNCSVKKSEQSTITI